MTTLTACIQNRHGNLHMKALCAGGLETKDAAHTGLENRQGAGGRSKDKMVLSKYLHILGVTTTTTPTSVWRQSGCPAIMRTPRVSVTSINLRAIRALESSLRSSFQARSNRGSSMKLSVRAKILQWYITLMYLYVVFLEPSSLTELKKKLTRIDFKSIWSVVAVCWQTVAKHDHKLVSFPKIKVPF